MPTGITYMIIDGLLFILYRKLKMVDNDNTREYTVTVVYCNTGKL